MQISGRMTSASEGIMSFMVADPVSAFILAGGQSTRMGRDKALLEVAGRTLVERMMAIARLVTTEVHLVGSTTTLAHFGSVIEDCPPDMAHSREFTPR